MPPLATLVLAEQHGGNRPPVLFPHQGSRHPESLNNSILGGFFLPEVNVDLPVLSELTLAVHHHVVDHLSVEMIQIHKYTITEIQKYANPQILKYTAQCAFWVVRWPCSQMAIAVKTLSIGKTIVLRLFLLYCSRKKTLKLVSLFIFRH